MKIFGSIHRLFTEHKALKLTALVLALGFWFYIAKELDSKNSDEGQFLNKVLPKESVSAKKLTVKPLFIGKPRRGYKIDQSRVLVAPDYVIVVGTKDMLDKIKFAYTMPIDTADVSRSFIKSVPLNSIAPGVFLEETAVQVTVMVERER